MDVMAILPVVHNHVQIHPGIHCQLGKEFKRQFSVIDSKLALFDCIRARILEMVPPTQIDSNGREDFVHGKDTMSISADSALVAQGLMNQATENDCRIFYGMVAIDIEIAAQVKIHVNTTVLGNVTEHVLEEGNLCVEGMTPGSIEIYAEGDISLGCLALGFCCSGLHYYKIVRSGAKID